MTTSLSSLHDEIETIAKVGAGTDFEYARVLGKLRGASRSLVSFGVTSEERIGREFLARDSFWRGCKYKLKTLRDKLHLNRQESRELIHPFGFGNSKLSASEAFDVVKQFLEKNGGWSGHDMRINRQAEQTAKSSYNYKRKNLQSRISASEYQEDHSVQEATRSRREAAKHDEDARVAAGLKKQLLDELNTLKRNESQRPKLFKPPTKKKKTLA